MEVLQPVTEEKLDGEGAGGGGGGWVFGRSSLNGGALGERTNEDQEMGDEDGEGWPRLEASKVAPRKFIFVGSGEAEDGRRRSRSEDDDEGERLLFCLAFWFWSTFLTGT